MTHENPFAFPCVAFDATGDRHWQEGMDLRDWFAGQALAGLLSDRSSISLTGDQARTAYRYADAMLAARTGDTK